MVSFELGDTESQLIATIYQAAFDLSKWKGVLADICALICANEASLLFYDAHQAERNFVETAYNEDNQEFVARHIDAEVKVLRMIMSGCAPGQLVSAQQIATQLGVSYEEYLGAPAQVSERQAYQARMAIPLIISDATYAVMGLHCYYGAPDLSAEAVAFISRLSPHVVNSICIHNRITSLQHERDALITTLQLANTPAILVGGGLNIVYMSDCAKQIIDANTELFAIENGCQLNFKSSQHQSHLEACV